MKHSSIRGSFARGFLGGFFLIAPAFSILFLIQDEFAFLPGPAFCPSSISMRTSDAELRWLARSIEKAGCTLVFASSEGASTNRGLALHELSVKPGFVIVRDYHGFASLRAIAYARRTRTQPSMRVLVNHHYARSSNRPAPDLGETWFAEGFAQSRLKSPGVLAAYLRETNASRIGPLREFFFRMNRSMLARLHPQPDGSQKQQLPEAAKVARVRDAIENLDGTLFAQALAEVCKEPGAQIVILPLNSKMEREAGLDPAEQMNRIQTAAASACKNIHTVQGLDNFWHDRIHWNETGRRLLLHRITESSLL